MEHCDRKCEAFHIEETFLKGDGNREERIKMRNQGSTGRIYSACRRDLRSKGRVIETKRIISIREYLSLMHSADPLRKTLSKWRICFGHKDHCLVLDRFINKDTQFSLLRLVTSYSREEASDKVFELPPFLKVLREVTDEQEYQLENIALKDWEMPEADREVLAAVGRSPKNGYH